MGLKEALRSLQGLSVGDAFGEQFFRLPSGVIERRELPPGPWPWTDDTHMALSIVEILQEYGQIEQDALARQFAQRYVTQPYRGYGSGARRLLEIVARGADWRDVAPGLFPGGSYGNGAAMRAAPVGAFYAGNPERAAAEARLSAEVTHAHAEGQASAMAVAAAAAVAAGSATDEGKRFQAEEFLLAVLEHIPAGETHDGVVAALSFGPGEGLDAAQVLGSGNQVSAQDTVPFCLWSAAHNLTDYTESLWVTVSGRGDRDTTCAIVGGITVLTGGPIPEEWLERSEPLPEGF